MDGTLSEIKVTENSILRYADDTILVTTYQLRRRSNTDGVQSKRELLVNSIKRDFIAQWRISNLVNFKTNACIVSDKRELQQICFLFARSENTRSIVLLIGNRLLIV